MKKFVILFSLLITGSLFLSSYSSTPSPSVDTDELNIEGTWIRKSDKLKIRISKEKGNQLHSLIVGEGTKKFPCDVSSMPIYKNIIKIKENLWRCDFLVVTMGSCLTEYEEGMIRTTKEGDLEITCPGFSKKLYTRLKPRYESSEQPD